MLTQDTCGELYGSEESTVVVVAHDAVEHAIAILTVTGDVEVLVDGCGGEEYMWRHL